MIEMRPSKLHYLDRLEDTILTQTLDIQRGVRWGRLFGCLTPVGDTQVGGLHQLVTLLAYNVLHGIRRGWRKEQQRNLALQIAGIFLHTVNQLGYDRFLRGALREKNLIDPCNKV